MRIGRGGRNAWRQFSSHINDLAEQCNDFLGGAWPESAPAGSADQAQSTFPTITLPQGRAKPPWLTAGGRSADAP